MSTRNERRRRVRERQQRAAHLETTHTGRMVARVVKADAQSQQVSRPGDDGFSDLYLTDRAIPPPLPLDNLWTIYEQNSYHSACIDAKVADAVGRGWVLELDDDDEVDEDDARAQTRRVRDALRDLARPSGMQGGFTALVRQLARELDATGWGAWEVSRDGERIAALFPLPPHTLRACKNDKDLYVQVKGDKKVYFKRFGAEKNYDARSGEETSETSGDNVANEVIVTKHYSPRSPYYGIPPWISGVPAVAEFTAIREYNVSWFESGGTGDRSVHVTADDASVAKTIADSIEESLKASKGIGHTTLITDGTQDTEVHVEMLSPEVGKRDGQFGNRRHDLVQELLTAHSVPAYRIGWAIVGELGGDAAEEMIDSYRYGVVEPLQEALEELLADTIFNPEAGGLDLAGYVFKFKDLDWTQQTEEIQKATALHDAGAITLNEMRVMLGEERGDDPRLDEFYGGGQTLGSSTGLTPDALDAVDVVDGLRKALEVAVRFEKDGHTLTAATDTAVETEDDLPVASADGEQETADASVDKWSPGKGKKKKPGY